MECGRCGEEWGLSVHDHKQTKCGLCGAEACSACAAPGAACVADCCNDGEMERV